jgi:hypothetical protein
MLSTIPRPILSSRALRSDKLKESFGELAFLVELFGVGPFFSDFIATGIICQISNGVNYIDKGRRGVKRENWGLGQRPGDNVVGSGRMGGALGLCAARCDPFGRGLSGAAREQPATVGVGPARTVGGVLWGPRGTRTANGRGVRPLGSGTRLEPSSADRPHLGSVYVVVAVWLPTRRRRAISRLWR